MLRPLRPTAPLFRQAIRLVNKSPKPPQAAPPLSQDEIAATKLKYRRIIWTVAFAAVIITGTIYGAGLKTQREWKTEKKKVEQLSADQRIAMLEQHRADLVRQKREIEAKLAEVRARSQQTDR
ncbi:hypothetical protein VTJ83DRAFT_1574 [Remersonia thermophila]|uniref:Uncharacterized protein n=1 Tax=Remersonia thermophila TaxID=72144 RepID=A0ABR4DGB8_9PEZI